MQKNFERDLLVKNDYAKSELGLSENDTIDLSYLEISLAEMAFEQNTTQEVQQNIYELQKQKQVIMEKLRQDLACLDGEGCNFEIGREAREAKFDEVTKTFSYKNNKGQEVEATLGEVVTDMDWDIYYNLDTYTTPRQYLKKYLVEKTKVELRDLLDRQIIASRVGDRYVNDEIQDTYRNIEYGREIGADKRQSGFISETVVKNFLKQLTIDKNLPFIIKEADVFQDVEQKMDFIVHKKEKTQGVRVETDENVSDVAIQFTVNESAVEKKKRQIERAEKVLKMSHEDITDIALVVFPLTMANQLKKDWEKAGMPAGGPGKFLSPEVEKQLFFKLLKDIFSEEEIEGYWERAQ